MRVGWDRAQIELSKNVYLISVALLVTEIWPFKVWVKNCYKNSKKSLSIDENHHKSDNYA